MSLATKPAPFGPDLRTALIAMVRRRVPDSEVEDIVQQALAEAIESPHAPQESEALRRWIFGVAKNKVVDYHRRAGRESFELPDVAGAPAPHVEADLLRWAEKNLPDGAENQKTLDWMIREGEGEKLESIAESEKLPPPRVRQRVSRLRRHFKENWQREVALLAALGVIVSGIVLFILHKEGPEPITHEDTVPRAEEVRRVALDRCERKDWQKCLDGLEDARKLDPAGDSRPEIQEARKAASDALQAPPAPSATPLPTTTPPTPAPESTDSKLVVPPAKQGPTFAKPAPNGTPAPLSSGAFTAAPPSPKAPVTKPQGKTSNVGSDSIGGSSDLGSFGSTPAPPGTVPSGRTSPTKDDAFSSGVKGGSKKKAGPSK